MEASNSFIHRVKEVSSSRPKYYNKSYPVWLILPYSDLHEDRSSNHVSIGTEKVGGFNASGPIARCVGVTLESDDLINIPTCNANLLHSKGCSCDGATHEGDIGEWAGGEDAHP